MRYPVLLSCLAVGFLCMGQGWSEAEGASGQSAAKSALTAAEAQPGGRVSQSSAAAVSENAIRAASAPANAQVRSNALGEHAPLALFSLGSLVVGGAFYGIESSMHRSNVGYTAGDRSQLTAAVGLAGLTALLAAGTYFYYARTSPRDRNWDAQITGGVSPEGGTGIGALVSLPVHFLSGKLSP